MPLRDAEEVGRDAGVLAREEPSRASEAGRHLVGDEERPVATGERMQRAQVGRRMRPHAGGTLHQRLDDDRGERSPRVRRERALRLGAARRRAPTPASMPRCQRKTCGGVRRIAGWTALATKRWKASE